MTSSVSNARDSPSSVCSYRSTSICIRVHHRHDQVPPVRSSRRVKQNEFPPRSRQITVDVMVRIRTYRPVLAIPAEIVITVIIITDVPILVRLIAAEKALNRCRVLRVTIIERLSAPVFSWVYPSGR